MEAEDVKTTEARPRAGTEQKSIKKASVSCDAELCGMHAQGKGQSAAGGIPAGPKGRFLNDWQAKPVQYHGYAGNAASVQKGYRQDRKKSREGRDARCTAKGSNAHQNFVPDYDSRIYRASLYRGILDGAGEYSSVCCGKCKHHLRVWRCRVWVCSNSESDRCGFPTDYENTCACFERDDR